MRVVSLLNSGADIMTKVCDNQQKLLYITAGSCLGLRITPHKVSASQQNRLKLLHCV